MKLLISLGGILVLLLSATALYLWRKVWAKKQAKKLREFEEHQTRLNYIHDSINVLAKSVLSDQVRVAEASIRMAVLLDNLDLSCEQKHLFAPITEVYNRTRHIPTHEQFSELSNQERSKCEKELREIELKLEHQVKEAAQHIKNNPFSL